MSMEASGEGAACGEGGSQALKHLSIEFSSEEQKQAIFF